MLIDENPTAREYKYLKENYKGWHLVKKQEYALHYKQGVDKIGLYEEIELQFLPKEKWRDAIVAFLGELEDYTKTLNSWKKIESDYKNWEPVKTKNTRIKGEDKEIYLQRIHRRYSEWYKVKAFNNVGRKYLFVTKSEYTGNSGFLSTLEGNTNARTEIYTCSETSLKYLMSLGIPNFYSLSSYTSSKFFKRWMNNSFSSNYRIDMIMFPTVINIERQLYNSGGKTIIRSVTQYEHLVDEHIKKTYNKIYNKYRKSPYTQASVITHKERVLAIVRANKYQKLIQKQHD